MSPRLAFEITRQIDILILTSGSKQHKYMIDTVLVVSVAPSELENNDFTPWINIRNNNCGWVDRWPLACLLWKWTVDAYIVSFIAIYMIYLVA